MNLERHRDLHGDLPSSGSRLVEEIAAAGLRGRGGAAFPLSLKLDAVRRGRRTPVVVVNACEGEPMSTKDRLLLSSLPHLVLDGAIAVARAIGQHTELVGFGRREAQNASDKVLTNSIAFGSFCCAENALITRWFAAKSRNLDGGGPGFGQCAGHD